MVVTRLELWTSYNRKDTPYAKPFPEATYNKALFQDTNVLTLFLKHEHDF